MKKAASTETTEQKRARRLAEGPQSGPGWHIEWATSAFDKKFRFQYVVPDREPIAADWEQGTVEE